MVKYPHALFVWDLRIPTMEKKMAPSNLYESSPKKGSMPFLHYVYIHEFYYSSSLAGILMRPVKTVHCTVTILVYLGNQCSDHCSFVTG